MCMDLRLGCLMILIQSSDPLSVKSMFSLRWANLTDFLVSKKFRTDFSKISFCGFFLMRAIKCNAIYQFCVLFYVKIRFLHPCIRNDSFYIFFLRYAISFFYIISQLSSCHKFHNFHNFVEVFIKNSRN